MFTTTMNKGFNMTFDNGWTVSVQWGRGNYCAAQDFGQGYGQEMKFEFHESETAEIAAWNEDGEWYNFGQDTVTGWKTPDEVFEFMAMIKDKQK